MKARQIVAWLVVAVFFYTAGAWTVHLLNKPRLGGYHGTGCQEDEFKWVDHPQDRWGCVHRDDFFAHAEQDYATP